MQFDRLKRREFISLLGSAAAVWPMLVRAQQSAMPVIGFLGASTPSNWAAWTASFLQGLHELGWIEGRTVKIEYRWVEAALVAQFVEDFRLGDVANRDRLGVVRLELGNAASGLCWRTLTQRGASCREISST